MEEQEILDRAKAILLNKKIAWAQRELEKLLTAQQENNAKIAIYDAASGAGVPNGG